MKPDWDKVMAEVNGKGSTLVGDVDCTAAGKPLCDSNGVQGFPTIKHGDPSALEDYQGGRDYASLIKFAEGLKPSCSPSNIDLCDDDAKAEINKFMEMDGFSFSILSRLLSFLLLGALLVSISIYSEALWTAMEHLGALFGHLGATYSLENCIRVIDF